MKILIVEDEQKMSEYLCKGLTEQGCAVDVAAGSMDSTWRSSMTTTSSCST
jgi:two-component system copper resistance phosphate regulon response regulator CusR